MSTCRRCHHFELPNGCNAAGGDNGLVVDIYKETSCRMFKDDLRKLERTFPEPPVDMFSTVPKGLFDFALSEVERLKGIIVNLNRRTFEDQQIIESLALKVEYFNFNGADSLQGIDAIISETRLALGFKGERP